MHDPKSRILRLAAVFGSILLLGMVSPQGAAATVPPSDCLKALRAARLAGLNGDLQAEARQLREAFETFPGEALPAYALHELHRQRPQDPELMAAARERIEAELASGNPSPSLVQGILDDPEVEEEWLEALRQSLENSPNVTEDARRLEYLAELGLRFEDRVQTVKWLEALLKLKESGRLRWQLMRHYQELQRWDDLLVLLKQRSTKPQGRLYEIYVTTLAHTGQLDEFWDLVPEADDAVTALGMPPEMAGRLFETLAWILRDGGHNADAEKLFRRTLALQPNNSNVQATLLHFYSTPEERRQHEQQLASQWQSETDAESLFQEGTQRLTNGDAAGAIELLERAAPLLADREAAWYNYGLAAYKLKDWGRAQTAFGKASELAPMRMQSHLYRGLALFHLEECEGSSKALERAYEIDSSQTVVHYYLSACYRKLGQDAKAAEQYQLYQATKAES